MGVVEGLGALAGGEGGKGATTGRGRKGALTGRAGALLGTANGLTGVTGGLTGAAGADTLAGGVGRMAGASAGTAKGTATTGTVGSGDAEEVELLGNAFPPTAAAAIGVAEEEGIEELLEELFEGAAPEMNEGGMLARAAERPWTAD